MHLDRAGGGPVEACHEVQKRGFTGARRAEKGEKLAEADGEGDLVDGADAGFAHLVMPGNSVQLDSGLRFGHRLK